MSPLQDLLYHYLWEQRICPDDPDLRDAEHYADSQETALRQELTPAQGKALSRILEQRDICADIRNETIFRYALSLGLELSRL